MTRSPDQRLDAIEDELETAKRLLISAASYAESANLGLERLTERQDRTQAQLDQLSSRQDVTTTQLDRLTVTVEDISTQVKELTTAQALTQTQLDNLTNTQAHTQRQLDQLSSRVDEFVFQAQRLLTQNAERLIRVEGQVDRLEALFQLLNRNYSAQQSQLQEFQQTTGAALERIDRVLDYLLKQQGGET
jgi:chromosome segregation ATPase